MRLITALLTCTLLASVASAQELTPDKARAAQQHYKAGLELMSAENWDKAAEEFQAATAIDRLMAMAWYNLGQCRMNQKRYVEAVTAYESCRGAFEQMSTLSQKEREDRDRQRRDEITDLRDAIQRASLVKNASAQDVFRMEDRLRQLESMQHRDRAGEALVPAGVYLALGSAYFRQGKLQEAEKEYVEAVRLDKKLGAAHNNLAVIYLMTDRPDQAEESLKLAEKNGFRVNPTLKEDIKSAKQKKAQS